jgi:hypothetical protein
LASSRAEPVRYFLDLACNADGISLARNTEDKAKLAGYAKGWNRVWNVPGCNKLGAFAGLHFVHIES